MSILAALASLLGSVAHGGLTPRTTLDFDVGWRFLLGDDARASGEGFDDSGWEGLDLPHDWSIELPPMPGAPCGRDGGYFQTGIGWYRKSFAAPDGWKGKRVWVEFDGVYMNSDVWFNGRHLGTRPFGYSSFRYDLTSLVRFGNGRNVLAVRADNSRQTNSRWYSGSGIYRHVRLVVTGPVHVAHWGTAVTTPEVTASRAVVRLRTTVENESAAPVKATVRTTLADPDGHPAGTAQAAVEIEQGGHGETALDFVVSSPRLWSPDTPVLYTARTEIIAGGDAVDAVETPFGIRSIRFDAKTGFTLNGVGMKLKGTCVHHDLGPLGAASYDRAEERKVEILKASGYNAIRTSHNPPAPGLLEACDRLGMLVIDEAFDCWHKGKRPHDYHVAFDGWWRRDLDALVLRDRNHPCVIMWSIGNELEERAEPEGARIARELADYVRSLDPTRPVTAAINGVDPWRGTDAVFAALDVGGYNYQRWNYRPDHDRFPDRVMVATESNPPESFEYWMDTLDLPWVIGDFVWTGYDYLGEASIGYARHDGDGNPAADAYPWNQANCGDIDVLGFKRPQSYYRDILWGVGSKLWIAVHAPVPEGKKEEVSWWGWPDVRGSWTWPGQEGKPMKVEVYSACEMVELLLNGKSMGTQPASRTTRFIATFTVPYEPGTLTAVGSTAGKKVTEWKLKTAGAPAAIRLTPDRRIIKSGGADLSFVTVEVTDRDGLLQPNADHEVAFKIDGEGTIVAVGSANPHSPEPYVGDRRRAFRGRCLVVVKSGNRAGSIRLKAEADGLTPGEARIHVE